MKYLYSLILVLVCSISFGQIKKLDNPKKELIGKIAPGGASTVTMECYKYDSGYYLFRFKDFQYSHLNEWKKFEVNSDEDFETLYSYLKDGFENMPEENVILDLGKDVLFLKFSRFLGGKVVRINHASDLSSLAILGYTNQYTQKQIDKLFGKR
ncbi:hypothetical protein [Myroides odoratimimus]|uniref:hypothetical protein n=1 Tax=Myroides odoratimimus TaxID=76832 RepID=UPI002577E4F0|nr:hypothetical protein [Myroides odoratimimus]MDM1514469.1 hypothetical protein [Myroides odoratimimus]